MVGGDVGKQATHDRREPARHDVAQAGIEGDPHQAEEEDHDADQPDHELDRRFRAVEDGLDDELDRLGARCRRDEQRHRHQHEPDGVEHRSPPNPNRCAGPLATASIARPQAPR
jgi:hypothetical protein